MILKTNIQMILECEPEYEIKDMNEFIKGFNGLLKVEIANWVGKGDSITYQDIKIGTNVNITPKTHPVNPVKTS